MEVKNEIELVTNNDNGLFQTVVVPDKRKYKEVLNFEGKLYHHGIGKVISEDITPKFQGWTYDDYVREFNFSKFVRFLNPMAAHDDETYLERDELKANEIAELKMDGHRGLVFIGDNFNRAFSRTISKKTNWFTENTDQIPHIRDLILPDFAGTVLDGEFDYGTDSMGVQSVMGAKPENAIQFQFKNGFIQYNAFDILYYRGINVQQMPLWKRKIYLYKVYHAFTSKYANCNINFTKMYVHQKAYSPLWRNIKSYESNNAILDGLSEHISPCGSYVEKFAEKLAEGKEGLIIKDMDATYEQKRSKSFIKLKGMGTWDCFIIGLTMPTKEYDGKLSGDELYEKWKYWEALGDKTLHEGDPRLVRTPMIPVTKPYFMGWCGAIQFGVHRPMTENEHFELIENGLDEQAFSDGSAMFIDGQPYWVEHVGDCKGLSEELLEDLKQNADKYIRENRVLEVLANGLLDKTKGSLRHPRFARWRDDKSAEMCDFKSHIREV